jgi:transcriptional regulator with XRE-family HTH domain
MTNGFYNAKIIANAAQNIGLRALARGCDVNQRTIARAIMGKNLSIKTLWKLADGLKLPLCSLIGCDQKQNAPKRGK